MKISFLAGFAAGYVLGAKAGPERYEQIKAAAAQVKDNPTVQQKTQQVTEAVKGKASETVSRAKASDGSSSTPSVSTTPPITPTTPPSTPPITPTTPTIPPTPTTRI